jgi:hypothetical protein
MSFLCRLGSSLPVHCTLPVISSATAISSTHPSYFHRPCHFDRVFHFDRREKSQISQYLHQKARNKIHKSFARSSQQTNSKYFRGIPSEVAIQVQARIQPPVTSPLPVIPPTPAIFTAPRQFHRLVILTKGRNLRTPSICAKKLEPSCPRVLQNHQQTNSKSLCGIPSVDRQINSCYIERHEVGM